MGGRHPALPHAELAAHIRNKRVAAPNPRIAKLQREEPAYQTLFDLIALCQTQQPSQRPAPPQEYPQTFFELEELLSRVYSGAATAEESGQILSGLLASPVFYQRVLAKLETLAPQAAWEEAEALEGIAIKSDAEIMEIMTQTTPSPIADRQRQPNPVRLWIDDFVEGVHRITAREPAGALVWQMPATFIAGTVQAVAQALDFITGHRVLAFGAPLALFAFMFFFNEKTEHDFYTYDDRAPYDYDSGTRGPSEPAAADSLLIDFKGRFKLAMSDYMLRDYPRALQILEGLQPNIAALSSHTSNENFAALMRDYYFYTGVSHFAWSRSKRFKQNREHHAEQAVYWLARADSLTQAGPMPQSEREAFFLGLAYGFAEQKDKALAVLRKIPSTSFFYQQSIERINEWSKP